jgi:hypothetical protein
MGRWKLIRRTPSAAGTDSFVKPTRVAFRGDGLPPPALREQLATAVSYAVSTVAGHEDPRRLCVLHAAAGAAIAGDVLGYAYVVQAGALHVDVSSKVTWCLDPRVSGAAPDEFHAWFARRHPDGRTELVDLTAGMWQSVVMETLGGSWKRPALPRYLWTWAKDFTTDPVLRGIRYRTDARTTAHIQRGLRAVEAQGWLCAIYECAKQQLGALDWGIIPV